MSIGILAGQVTGPVLVPGDDGYADETSTWNLAMAGKPAVVVGATSSDDVRAAVGFAVAQGLPIAVTATGHGQSRPADGAVLINLRRMNGIVVDAGSRTATVGAAVEMQDVVDEAAKLGLAPLAGSSPNVGVVGYTLGGGLSPLLGRAFGWAVDQVLAAEIVTADGELRRVDADTEPDLFWAIRGGTSNFGVITSLTFGLVPVTRLYGGGIYFDGADSKAVLEAFGRLTAAAPDELTASVALLRLPPLPFVPEPLRGRLSVHLRIAYLGSAEEGDRLLADVRAAATPIIDQIREMPFTEFATVHADPVDPVPAYESSALLDSFPAEAIERLLDVAGPDTETPLLMVEIRHLGGALADIEPEAGAVSGTAAPYGLFTLAAGQLGVADKLREPLQTPIRALGSWVTDERQINFFSGYDRDMTRVREAYRPEAWDRLRDIKRVYDPRNVFRVNYNIPPADQETVR
jgi:FAD/FMN-containing dehydrogenase